MSAHVKPPPVGKKLTKHLEVWLRGIPRAPAVEGFVPAGVTLRGADRAAGEMGDPPPAPHPGPCARADSARPLRRCAARPRSGGRLTSGPGCPAAAVPGTGRADRVRVEGKNWRRGWGCLESTTCRSLPARLAARLQKGKEKKKVNRCHPLGFCHSVRRCRCLRYCKRFQKARRKIVRHKARCVVDNIQSKFGRNAQTFSLVRGVCEASSLLWIPVSLRSWRAAKHGLD